MGRRPARKGLPAWSYRGCRGTGGAPRTQGTEAAPGGARELGDRHTSQLFKPRRPPDLKTHPPLEHLHGDAPDTPSSPGRRGNPRSLLALRPAPPLWPVQPPGSRHSLRLLLFFFFFFCLFAISWAAPAAYGSSQARGRIGAVAASLCSSRSNVRSKLCLQPTPQRTAMLDP